jgi:hypothetical protein
MMHLVQLLDAAKAYAYIQSIPSYFLNKNCHLSIETRLQDLDLVNSFVMLHLRRQYVSSPKRFSSRNWSF